MATKSHAALHHQVNGATSFIGTLLLAALAVLLIQHLLSAPRASAQSEQNDVVRASAFVLVGPDGQPVARLQTGPGGNGQLLLFDGSSHKVRTLVGGNGTFKVFDPDGTTLRYYAGYAQIAGSPDGLPPVNGLLLGPDGAVGTLTGCVPPTNGAPLVTC